jgi:hypothetical protein
VPLPGIDCHKASQQRAGKKRKDIRRVLNLHWMIFRADRKSNKIRLSAFSTVAENQVALNPDLSNESFTLLILYNSKLITEQMLPG